MAVVPEKISNHIAKALARLAQQYKDKPRIAAVLGVFVYQVQQIEDAGYDVMIFRRLANAEGEQLDVIGRIVGQDRESADDAEYRLRLAARIRANLSTGSAEDILTVFAILLPDNTFKLTPYYPAAFTLEIMGDPIDEDLLPLYVQFLADTKAAGVGAQLIWSSDDPDEMFAFAGEELFFMQEARSATDMDVYVGSTFLADGSPSPSSGTLLIGEGTAEEETIAFSGNTGNRFLVGGLANNHENGSSVKLLEVETDGKGYGDTGDPDTGGKYASVEQV